MHTCVVHLVRNSRRYASKATGANITTALRTVYMYTAPTVAAVQDAFEVFVEAWDRKHRP